MKFEYKDQKEADREVVAELYWMNDDPSSGEQALCIKTEDPYVFIWMYSDGSISLQLRVGFGEGAIKKFYKGDKITITF